MTRSNRREVRNPVLALPSAQRLLTQDTFTRADLREILLELRDDCRDRAEKCWRTHKGPMALYWKTTGVLAGHFGRLLK
jgi:hypothetical protein